AGAGAEGDGVLRRQDDRQAPAAGADRAAGEVRQAAGAHAGVSHAADHYSASDDLRVSTAATESPAPPPGSTGRCGSTSTNPGTAARTPRSSDPILAPRDRDRSRPSTATS